MTTPTPTPSAARAMPIAQPVGRWVDVTSFLAAIAALRLTPPPALTSLVAGVEIARAVPSPPGVAQVADGRLSEAVAGTLTADGAAKAIEAAAFAVALVDRRQTIRAAIQQGAVKRFHAEIVAGAADELLDQVRPIVASAAATIAEARTTVNLDFTTAEFIDTAGPDELAAYQNLKAALLKLKLNSVAAFVRFFGAHGEGRSSASRPASVARRRRSARRRCSCATATC
jgi:hypothetical protein